MYQEARVDRLIASSTEAMDTFREARRALQIASHHEANKVSLQKEGTSQDPHLALQIVLDPSPHTPLYLYPTLCIISLERLHRCIPLSVLD